MTEHSESCDNCPATDATQIEYCIQEEWHEVRLCPSCLPLLTKPFIPLVRISRLVDTTRARRHAGRITRQDVETGALKAVGSAPDAPLLMGLRVTGGLHDLVGRIVKAKFTEDEVLEILAFLVSRAHWAHTLEAMLAQRNSADDDDHSESVRRSIKRAGLRAISEMWRGRREA